MAVRTTRSTPSRKRKKLKAVIMTTAFIALGVCAFIFRDKIAAALPFEISDTVSELIILRRGD